MNEGFVWFKIVVAIGIFMFGGGFLLALVITVLQIYEKITGKSLGLTYRLW